VVADGPVDAVEEIAPVPRDTDAGEAKREVCHVPTVRSAAIEIALGLAIVGLLIVVNGLFVAAEFSLVAVDRDRIEALAEQGSGPARTTLRMLSRLSLTLSGTQLGVTVISLVLALVAEPTAERIVDNHALAIVIDLFVVTILQMLIGELVPKGIGVAAPVRVSLTLSRPLRLYGIVVSPLTRVLNRASDATVRRLGVEPRDELRSVRTIDELELLITSSGREGTLDHESFEMLTRTIRFGHKTAADALVSRVDMVAIGRDANVADLVALALDTGYSRFPIVGDDLDDVIGVVHAKDALRIPTEARATTSVMELSAPATFIPEGRDLESLLTEMRANAVPLAVVADEYGGVAGIVTLEDLLEEIVGEIEDEYDPVSVTPAVPSPTTVVEGTLHLDEVREATGFEVPDGPYETLAGFVLDRLGHIPRPGERVLHEGWELEVVELDRRRIASIRVISPEGRD
jgi:CBS domain containing-hemolysin-like protein